MAIALLLALGGGWSMFLYHHLVTAEESSDLHLHVVGQADGESGESGLRQRIAMLEQGIDQLASQQREATQVEEEEASGEGKIGAVAVETLTLRQKTFVEGRAADGAGVADGDADGAGVDAGDAAAGLSVAADTLPLSRESVASAVLELAQQRAEEAVEAEDAQAAKAGGTGRNEAGGAKSKVGSLTVEERRKRVEERHKEQARNLLPLRPRRPDPPASVLSDDELTSRRREVEGAALHAWRGYVDHAWGHDELCPLSRQGKDPFGGLGATIMDSLDTLLMMGFTDEYARGLQWVREGINLTADFNASVFETTIRVVGGFLAAYELSGDDVLLTRSQEVVERLLPAYDTPTGIPLGTINLRSQVAYNPKWTRASSLAEFGTHQLEWYKLSQLSGDPRYGEAAQHSIRYLHEHFPDQGLLPLFLNTNSGKFTTRRVSLGALGDSYYEYLLKMWLLKDRSDDMYRAMWEKAMDEMLETLVMNSTEGHMYIAEVDRQAGRSRRHKMDHLVCFVPGMLALGVHSGAVEGAKADAYMAVAAGVTETCWQMYDRQVTGLAPEIVTFAGGKGMRNGASYNILRPEAVESFWYMWRFTRDWKYRAWGWAVFQSMQEHCKMEVGYSGIKDVRDEVPVPDDTQQSFFIAETLKYLWLLFSDDSSFDFATTVLNTEAHPLKVVPAPRLAAVDVER